MLRGRIHIVVPTRGFSYVDQMGHCLMQVDQLLLKTGVSKKAILKQTIFVRAHNNLVLRKRSEELTPHLEKFYGGKLPPTSFLGQLPDKEHFLAMEVTLLDTLEKETKIKHSRCKGVQYVTLEFEGIKEVIAAGVTGKDPKEDVGTQALEAFTCMKAILDKESLDFSHVVRQWNYIENITQVNHMENREQQNYQAFNDARSQFYDPCDFTDGFPAATGIGMNVGGVVLEFVAMNRHPSLQIVPLSNPQQTDAHRYSDEVLVGDPTLQKKSLASPKFERGKVVISPTDNTLYISGTAAIKGQETVPDFDAREQTQITIENIRQLTSRDNLQQHGINHLDSDPHLDFTHLRVYVKNESDFESVRNACKRAYPNHDILYLIADVCRDNLLVEIEGIAHLKSE